MKKNIYLNENTRQLITEIKKNEKKNRYQEQLCNEFEQNVSKNHSHNVATLEDDDHTI